MPGIWRAIRRGSVSGLLACLGLVMLAPAAPASFHLIQIRELYPGNSGDPDDAFVVLQMYAPGQTQLTGRQLVLYDTAGAVEHTSPLDHDVSSGADQSTLMIGDTEAAVTPDFTVPTLGNFYSPFRANGAACFQDGSTLIDCVSWGAFAPTSLPTGTPVASSGIPSAQSIQRTIARGCPTALDPADDTNNSLADFSLSAPNPRNNSIAPSELACPVPTGTGGGGGDNEAPNTKIKKRPPNRTEDETPTYKFRSSESGSTFKCKIDKRRYRKCKSPKTLKNLDPGKHTFKVRATDKAGNTDNTPAKDTFKLLAD